MQQGSDSHYTLTYLHYSPGPQVQQSGRQSSSTQVLWKLWYTPSVQPKDSRYLSMCGRHRRGFGDVWEDYLGWGLVHVAHVALLGQQHTGVVHLLKLQSDRWWVGGSHFTRYLSTYFESLLTGPEQHSSQSVMLATCCHSMPIISQPIASQLCRTQTAQADDAANTIVWPHIVKEP